MTASMALVAIAASIAEPPARSTSTPALDASECGDVTKPLVASVTGRPVLMSKVLPPVVAACDKISRAARAAAAVVMACVVAVGRQVHRRILGKEPVRLQRKADIFDRHHREILRPAHVRCTKCVPRSEERRVGKEC